MRPFLVISAPSILAYSQTSVSDGGRIVSIDSHSLDRCSLIFGTPYWFARIARCEAQQGRRLFRPSEPQPLWGEVGAGGAMMQPHSNIEHPPATYGTRHTFQRRMAMR
jgi:hypothetical protein